jgi:hypothetical protein
MAIARILDAVGFTTTSTGTGGPLAVSAALTDANNGDFLLPADAGALNGETYAYKLIQGNDWELNSGVYSTTGPTIARGTPAKSKIGGTVSTTALTLVSGAKVFFLPTALVALPLAFDVPLISPRNVKVLTAAGPYTTLLEDDYLVVRQTVAAAFAITIPAPTSKRWLTIKDGKGDAGTNHITITPSSGTIDGSANAVIAIDDGVITLVPDGTQWNVT